LVSDELESTGKAIVSEDDSFDFGADETVIPVSEDLVFDLEDIGISKAELCAAFLEAVAQGVYAATMKLSTIRILISCWIFGVRRLFVFIHRVGR